MTLMLNPKDKKLILGLLEKESSKECELLAKKIQKSMASIKPRSAKQKGLNWQMKVAAVIGELLGIEASQSDDSLISSRLSGQNGTDIVLRGEAKKFGFSVECKSCETISLPKWIEQAKANETEDMPWILFIHSRAISDKEIVVLKLEDFKRLYKRSN